MTESEEQEDRRGSSNMASGLTSSEHVFLLIMFDAIVFSLKVIKLYSPLSVPAE